MKRPKYIGWKLHAFKGTSSYELQVGPLVIQWYHVPSTHRLHVWFDAA